MLAMPNSNANRLGKIVLLSSWEVGVELLTQARAMCVCILFHPPSCFYRFCLSVSPVYLWVSSTHPHHLWRKREKRPWNGSIKMLTKFCLRSSNLEMDLHVHLLALLPHHLKHCNFMNIYIIVGAFQRTFCNLKSRSFGSYSTPANIGVWRSYTTSGSFGMIIEIN